MTEDYQIKGRWAKTKRVEGKEVWTRSFQKWHNMISRCKPDGAHQRDSPTYIGCELSEEFKNYQYFVEWHRAQTGYLENKYHLDKDLLLLNNKIYAPTTCVLIPQALNTFLCDSRKARGEYPQGMYFDTDRGKIHVQVNMNKKVTFLGRYTNLAEAKRVYKEAKENIARNWYQRLINKEFIVDNRVIERMKTWTINLE